MEFRWSSGGVQVTVQVVVTWNFGVFSFDFEGFDLRKNFVGRKSGC